MFETANINISQRNPITISKFPGWPKLAIKCELNKID